MLKKILLKLKTEFEKPPPPLITQIVNGCANGLSLAVCFFIMIIALVRISVWQTALDTRAPIKGFDFVEITWTFMPLFEWVGLMLSMVAVIWGLTELRKLFDAHDEFIDQRNKILEYIAKYETSKEGVD